MHLPRLQPTDRFLCGAQHSGRFLRFPGGRLPALSFMRFTTLVTALAAINCTQASAQQSPFTFHARAFIAQYYCFNQHAQNDPARAYFFTPSFGANWDAVARYRPDSSRFFCRDRCICLAVELSCGAGHTRYAYAIPWLRGRPQRRVGRYSAAFRVRSGKRIFSFYRRYPAAQYVGRHVGRPGL